MIKCYSLSVKEMSSGYAKLPDDVGFPLDRNIIEKISVTGEMPYEFTLKRVSFSKGDCLLTDDVEKEKYIWTDCQMGDFLLFSQKLKDIISNHLTGNERFKWVSCKVHYREEVRIYYTPVFTEKIDVWNMEYTVFSEWTDSENFDVLKPVFSQRKIESLGLFCGRYSCYSFWKMPGIVYIKEDTKKEIVKAKLLGVELSQAPVDE